MVTGSGTAIWTVVSDPPGTLGFHWYEGLLLPLDDSNKSNLALCHKDYEGLQSYKDRQAYPAEIDHESP